MKPSSRAHPWCSKPIRSNLAAYLLAGAAVLLATDVYAAVMQTSQAPADQFVKEVISNEIRAEEADNSHWTYEQVEESAGRVQVEDIVDTKEGSLHRLISLNGHPLTAAQQEAEDQRIKQLLADPGQLRQQQEKKHADDEKMMRLMRMLPNAFHYQYDGSEAGCLRLRFVPNPSFRPPDREAQVFHHMEGTMLVDPQQKRLAGLEGHLTSEVKFGYGLLGHLDEGGTFKVRQQEVGRGVWELTLLDVQMNGKALIFKTVTVHQNETYKDYRLVPPDLTLKQAAELLRKKNTPTSVASTRSARQG
jgi:hypothetical protein